MTDGAASGEAVEGTPSTEAVAPPAGSGAPFLEVVPVDDVTGELEVAAVHYRGSRRRLARWRRDPISAVSLVALVALVTVVGALQFFNGGDPAAGTPGDPWRADVPGVLPPIATQSSGVPVLSPSATPSASASASASPSPSRSRSPSAAPSPTTPSPAASPSTATPSPTPSRTPSLAPARLLVGSSNKCIVAPSSSTVRLDDCDDDETRWSLPGDGTVRTAGRCLDVRGGGTSNETEVQLFSCNGSAAQQWIQRGDRSWLNPRSGRCLDTLNSSTSDGARLVIFNCDGSSSQRWRLV